MSEIESLKQRIAALEKELIALKAEKEVHYHFHQPATQWPKRDGQWNPQGPFVPYCQTDRQNIVVHTNKTWYPA